MEGRLMNINVGYYWVRLKSDPDLNKLFIAHWCGGGWMTNHIEGNVFTADEIEIISDRLEPPSWWNKGD
jgi:hypothetical protein